MTLQPLLAPHRGPKSKRHLTFLNAEPTTLRDQGSHPGRELGVRLMVYIPGAVSDRLYRSTQKGTFHRG